MLEKKIFVLIVQIKSESSSHQNQIESQIFNFFNSIFWPVVQGDSVNLPTFEPIILKRHPFQSI